MDSDGEVLNFFKYDTERV